jgi:phosphoribosylamine--glycine ligase
MAMKVKQKILVVGGGGREAATVWKLKQDDPNAVVFCAPGNAGIAKFGTCVPIEATDIEGLLAFAHAESIVLTIVGPELPLVAGIVDRFREHHLLICGTTAAAARAEGSKIHFKEVLIRNEIPTAPYQAFDDQEEALAYIELRGVENIVIKADGPMAGKGVILPHTLEEAALALQRLMVIGTPGEKVLIEDRLIGLERSVIAITDGTVFHLLPFTQDYKRLRTGDLGPNTGGMGAHTLDLPAEEEVQLRKILGDVLTAFRKERCLYSGFIYLGIMMTADGPKVLELNCRLGDPETQPILASIDGNFLDLCMAAAHGNLSTVPEPTRVQHALCVVLASPEYTELSERNDAITGIEDAEAMGALVFHAGTGVNDKGEITTNKSGRVLVVVGRGETIGEAGEQAYAAVKPINFPGMQYRTDIGAAYI